VQGAIRFTTVEVSSSVSGAAPASPEKVADSRDDPGSLAELLNETRIILPGTEVFLGFLMTIPFTLGFAFLDDEQRLVYLATFFAMLLSVAFFVAPAAYHRIARPIVHKERFKVFATTLIVIGLAPASIAFVLVTYLVSSLVFPRVAVGAAAIMAGLILALWWAVPILRVHDRFRLPNKAAGQPAE
jgi:hypothetical protein